MFFVVPVALSSHQLLRQRQTEGLITRLQPAIVRKSRPSTAVSCCRSLMRSVCLFARNPFPCTHSSTFHPSISSFPDRYSEEKKVRQRDLGDRRRLRRYFSLIESNYSTDSVSKSISRKNTPLPLLSLPVHGQTHIRICRVKLPFRFSSHRSD